MKIKKTPNPSLAKSVGTSMRLIRLYKGESVDAVALKLGYKHSSSYCKVERGEVQELSLEMLLGFCNHFNIKFIVLMMLADNVSQLDLHVDSHSHHKALALVDQKDQLLYEEIIHYKDILLR
jgi:hypothetical protein